MVAKTILVTGASSGIGEATVQRLLAAGHDVHAGARRLDRMQPLADAGAQVLPLDLTDPGSLTAAVATVLRTAGRIDVLVNNAGYSCYGALEDVPPDEARRQLEVNLFGAARLTQLVLPTMRAQRSGRIVNISSIGGKFGGAFGAWYHASKFAVEGLSDALRMELRAFGIDVVLIEPGATMTEGNGNARAGLIRYSGDGPYGDDARAHADMMAAADRKPIAAPPGVVADTIVKAIAARKPRTRYPTGGSARTILLLRSIMSDRSFDSLLRMSVPRPGRRGRRART